MVVVSFFTPNGRYPQMARQLSASCARLGLKYRIAEVPDQGNWMASNNLKPHIILQSLLEARDPVLWCDIDTEILRPPALLLHGPMDFAIYNWRADPDNVLHIPVDPDNLRGSGGVMCFGYTAPAIELVIRWRDLLAAKPSYIDDQMLDIAYNTYRPPVRPLWLPKTYNWMSLKYGPVNGDVVIRHDCVDAQFRVDGGHRAGPLSKG